VLKQKEREQMKGFTMSGFYERHQKHLFIACLIIAYGMILLYNVFTPYMLDDISYRSEVKDAHSLWDLVVQQYGDYMYWNARVVGQFILRLSLVGDKHIFNIANSAVFVVMIYLIQINILPCQKEKHLRQNPFVFLLVLAFTWRYAVYFAYTILWLSGACNFLWTTTIILGFITICRRKLASPYQPTTKIKVAVSCLWLFVFGVVAGWCSENTSGAMIILLLMLSFLELRVDKTVSKTKITIMPHLIAAYSGALTGFLFLILSPGVRVRMEGDLTRAGVSRYVLRLNQLLLATKECLFELLCIVVIVVVLLLIFKANKKPILTQCFPFLLAGIVSCLAMLLTPHADFTRAYFGAGIFLIIACLRAMILLFFREEWDNENANSNDSMEKLFVAARYITVILLWLWLLFDYPTNFVTLFRIWQEDKRNVAIINEAKEKGLDTAVIISANPEYVTRYTIYPEHSLGSKPDPEFRTYYNGNHQINIQVVPEWKWEEMQEIK
jgi:hypothetical protein